MDIAYYISDLLGQQGELSVPNLGYFVQTQMSARYDEKTKKFFPPYYAVQFDPQAIDDDETLAAHIAGLKKISLASAKYFIEKYTINLKNQVIIEDVDFAGMGTFSSDGIKLVFKSGQKNDDPAYFAFTPIDVYKVGQQAPKKPITEPEEPTKQSTAPVNEPVASYTAPVEELPEQPEGTGDEYEYEEEPPRRMSMWIIVLIVFTVMVIALVGVYKFKPELFKGIIPAKNDTTAIKPVAVKKDTSAAQLPADTAAKDTIAKPDTSTGNPKVADPGNVPTVQAPVTTTPVATTPVATTDDERVPKGQWVIRAGTYNTKRPADKRIDELKGRGFAQTRLEFKNVRQGNNYKVILGAYKTREEAISAKQDIIATGKIKASDEIRIEQVQ